MGNRTSLRITVLLALLIWSLTGCGGQDETPPEAQTTQTQALVPDSVVIEAEQEVIDPVVEIPVDQEVAVVPDEVPATEQAEPQVEAPALVEKAIETPPTAPGNGIFSLQLGSYTVAAFAEEKAADLRKIGHPATVEQAEVGGTQYHRVFIRGLNDRRSAEKLGEELHSSLGLSYLIRRK